VHQKKLKAPTQKGLNLDRAEFNSQSAPEPTDEAAYNAALGIENPGNGGVKLSPHQFFSLRQGMDQIIPWTDETKTIVERALKNGRTAMMQELIDNGGSEYRAAMEDMANKLQARDALAAKVRGNPEKFIDHLYGKDKTAVQDELKTLDNLIGTDYAKQARAAQYAQELGNKGKPGWFSQGETGKYATMPLMGALGYGAASMNPAVMGGAALGLAAQSPKVATGAIAGARGLKDLGARIAGAGERLAPGFAGPVTQTSMEQMSFFDKPAIKTQEAVSPNSHIAVYNGKEVPMDYEPDLKKQFTRAAQRIIDNGASEGVVVAPDGKYFYVSQGSRSAKKITKEEAEAFIEKNKRNVPKINPDLGRVRIGGR